MNKLLCLPWIALALLIAPGRVFAAVDNDGLDCASATELSSGKTYSGNTKYSNDFIEGIGPYSSPGKDRVYTFTATESTGPISIDWADYDFAAFVTTDCRTLAPAPLTVVTSSTPAQLDLSSLAGGQRYYLIVTGNPAASTDIEGAYSLSTTWLGPDGNGDGGLDCASATELLPDTAYVGDTRYAGNPIESQGPIPNASNDHVYTFTATADSWVLAVEWANYDFFAFLSNTCDSHVDVPPVFAMTTAPAYLDLSGLVPGQRYYVIVSGTNPFTPGDQGAYVLATPWAKTHLSDAIFSSGFD